MKDQAKVMPELDSQEMQDEIDELAKGWVPVDDMGTLDMAQTQALLEAKKDYAKVITYRQRLALAVNAFPRKAVYPYGSLDVGAV